MTANWKNKEYIDSVMAFAEIMAKSQAINICFQGKVETCAALIMQADQWNIDDPFYVGANSYFDQYGRIAQTGRLMERIISKHPSVKSVSTSYNGDWNAIANKVRFEYERPIATWDVSLERGLMVTILIEFNDGSSYDETLCLADIDPSFRQLNNSWATSPKKQIFNHLIRNIGHFELSQLVLGYDQNDVDASTEQESKLSAHKVSTLPPSKKQMSNDVTQNQDVNSHRSGVDFSEKLEKLYSEISDAILMAKSSVGNEQNEAMQTAYKGLLALKSLVHDNKESFTDSQASLTKKQYEELVASFEYVTQTAA